MPYLGNVPSSFNVDTNNINNGAVTSPKLSSGLNIDLDSGSAATPSLTFDANTGLYSPGEDQVAISTNGTGRITIDGSGNVNIDSNTLYVDATNNRVGVGTTSPQSLLHIDGDATAFRISRGSAIGFLYNTGTAATDAFRLQSNGGSVDLLSPASQPITFSAGGSEKVRITSAGLVGIGSSSPVFLTDILSGTANTGANVNNPSQLSVTGPNKSLTAGGATVFINSNSDLAIDTGGSIALSGRNTTSSTNSVVWGVIKGAKENATSTNTAGYLAFASTNHGAGGLVEAMRIDSSQRVGIGTTSPSANLHVRAENSDTIADLLRLEQFNAASTDSARLIIQANAANNEIIYNSTGQNIGAHVFQRAGTESARIDSSGRLLVGTSTAYTIGSSSSWSFQTATPGIAGIRPSNDTNPCTLTLAKTRSTALGSYTIVQNNDNIGIIDFAADDGTDYATSAARIIAQVDGTPGANDMPGRLVFSTTADGASSPTERIRIDSSGRLLLGTATTTNNIRSQSKQAIVITGDTNRGGLDVTAYVGGTNTGAGPQINLQRSIGTTDGSMTALTAAGWRLGAVNFFGSDGTSFGHGAAIEAQADDLGFNANDYPTRLVFATTADGSSSPTERFRINNAGSFSAVIPSGSTLFPAFFTRAWVNFNGTGTVAIRASGNVSSITDNGVGDYTVNLTTAMPDANYSVVATTNRTSAVNGTIFNLDSGTAPTTTAVKLLTFRVGTGVVDTENNFVAIFR